MNTKFRFITHLCTLAIAMLALGACNEHKDVEKPTDFDVRTNKTTCEVGEYVEFFLTGNPDIISYYSGEAGNSYEYADKDRILDAIVEFSFSTYVRAQVADVAHYGADVSAAFTCQEDQLDVLVSSDYILPEGVTDSLELLTATKAAVQTATWTSIADKYTLCPVTCDSGPNSTPAGVSDITDYFVEDKPLFIAFKYTNFLFLENGKSNIWRFTGFSVDAVIEDIGSKENLLNQANGNWKPAYVGPEWGAMATRYSDNGSVVMLRGNSYNDNEEHSLWSVSAPINFSGDANVGVDKAVALKSVSDIPLEIHRQKFTLPGVYTVTFIARNTNIYGEEEVVRQIEITVVDPVGGDE